MPSAATRSPLLALTLALGGCLAAGEPTEVAVAVAGPPPAPEAPGLVKDDLGIAKDQFAREHYGLAELHFRRAVEADKTNPEAWLGLAASYDQLRRPRLADRAYAAALKLTGPTPAFLNNRGYSYLLRGDLRRASEDLTKAAGLAPDDPRIQDNLRVLDARLRGAV